MKKILFIPLLILGLWGCQDDETVFDVSMPKEQLSFQPVAGGAVMHYKLPEEEEVLAIRVRYRDAQGKEILRTGSYACDTLILPGFNEARQGVEAHVSLCDRDNVESKPVRVTFDTKDSGPVSFFDKLEVKPNWNGFMISFDVPKGSKVLVHVLYVGKDPMTLEPDTLLLSSVQIDGLKSTLQFPLLSSAPTNTVVIRTEDVRGYMVKQKIWENVESYNTRKLDPAKFDFLDPHGLSVEDPEEELGKNYLFDGDTKGEVCFPPFKDRYKTFLAGPYCHGKPFIIDFKEPKHTAQLKLYALLNMRTDFPHPPRDGEAPNKYGAVWNGKYNNKLPCSVTIYGSNDKEDENSWEEISHFEQDPNSPNVQRWSNRSASNDDYKFSLTALADIAAAQPCEMVINIPSTVSSFRYLKLVIDNTFALKNSWDTPNELQYVTFHELEVYTKKD